MKLRCRVYICKNFHILPFESNYRLKKYLNKTPVKNAK